MKEIAGVHTWRLSLLRKLLMTDPLRLASVALRSKGSRNVINFCQTWGTQWAMVKHTKGFLTNLKIKTTKQHKKYHYFVTFTEDSIVQVVMWKPGGLCLMATSAKLVRHPYAPIVGWEGPVLPQAWCLDLSQYSAAQGAPIRFHYGRSQVNCLC